MDNVTDKFTPYHGPWKVGNIHLSAPCIYARVLEALELKPGLSFLNLGSGTGYLSTLAGLMIGPHGVNHGIEIHQNVVEYANEKVALFKQQSFALDKHDFLEPQFIQGDCLKLNPSTRRYDRVYLGATCHPDQEDYMMNLVKIGGILVMPINEQLVRYERTSEFIWDKQSLLSVIFNTLIDREGKAEFDLPFINPKSLNDICRDNIRHYIRDQIDKKYPKLKCCDNLKERNQIVLDNQIKMEAKSKANKHHHDASCVHSRNKSLDNGNSQRASSNDYHEQNSDLAANDGADDDDDVASSSSSSSSSSTTTGEEAPCQISLPFMVLERFVHNGLNSETNSSDDDDDEDMDSNEQDISESDNIDDCSEYDSDSDRAHEDIINMITLRNAASVFRIGFGSDENHSDSESDNEDNNPDDRDSTSSVSMSSGLAQDDKETGCQCVKSCDLQSTTTKTAPKSPSNDPGRPNTSNNNSKFFENNSATDDVIKYKEKRVEKDEERTNSRMKRRKNSDTSYNEDTNEDKMLDNSVEACSNISATDTPSKPSCSHQTNNSVKGHPDEIKSIDKCEHRDLNHSHKNSNRNIAKKTEVHPNARVKHSQNNKTDTSNDCNNNRPKPIKRDSSKSDCVKAKRKSVSKSKHEHGGSKSESHPNESKVKVKRPRISESRQYFDHMRKVILDLPLPHALKLYLNYDRKLTD